MVIGGKRNGRGLLHSFGTDLTCVVRNWSAKFIRLGSVEFFRLKTD